MLCNSLVFSALCPFHVELLALPFLTPASPESGRPSGVSVFAAPAPGGAPPPACGPSAPGHTCSGALRHRPAGSPLRDTRARGRSATGLRVLRSATAVLGRSPPLAGQAGRGSVPSCARRRSAPPPPAAGSAAPCARESLRCAPSGRRLRRPLRARAPPLRPLRPQAPQPLGAFPRHPRRPSASLRAGAPFFEAAPGGFSDFLTCFLLFLVALFIFAAFNNLKLTYAYEN